MTLQIQWTGCSKNQFKKQLVIVCSTLAIASQIATLTACAGAKSSTLMSSTAKSSKSLASASAGNFVDAEHPTAGQARIIQAGAERYLVFDKSFQTSAGPDLFVILHRTAVPKTYAKKDYVLLGKLKSTTGEQRYEIPSGVDLNAYQSVVIWCRQFSATFGYAKLTHSI
jgi:Electron transfer DM13